MKKKTTRPHTMEQLLLARADAIESEGRVRSANSYRSTARRLFTLGLNNISLRKFSAEHVDTAVKLLNSDGLAGSTVKFYLRILRAAYNRAVADGTVPDCHPFAKVSTTVYPSAKRCVSLANMRTIINLDLVDKPSHALARDMFVFMVVCTGMSFIDVAHLRPSDIKYDEIRYRRHKTGVRVVVPLMHQASEIMNRHSNSHYGYVFPLLDPGAPTPRAYDTVLRRTNRLLNEVGLMAGVSPLTTHMARHTWATAARNNKMSLTMISAALGHTSERTTMHYLAELDSALLREANEELMLRIFGKDKPAGNKKRN